MTHIRACVLVAAICTLSPLGVADAPPPSASAPSRIHAKILSLGANQSTNWAGYNQGFLEKSTLFTSVSGTWTVPTATQHTPGRAESSSVWIGIGGGCMETSCTLTDPTLIQAGTEQDVDASGKAAYSTWWEIIPLPALQTSLPVSAGDVVNVSIAQTLPELWQIVITNRTSGRSFTTTIPYASVFGSVEWIVETPVVLGTSGVGIAALPNLSPVTFREARANGKNPNLNSAEALELVQNGEPIATPSAPSGGDSFRVCTYSPSC